jgi:predicted membrane protein
MIFHQIGGQAVKKLTFWNKISLILWIGAILALLSFFTFTLFVIALVVGVVIFTLRLFRQNQKQTINSQNKKNNPFKNQSYHSRPSKDDDIIDI